MITVVSGIPRSGTSMMMQILAAGGMEVLAESEHTADTYNPRGYFEWARMKELQANPALIHEAEGKAVKVYSPFLPFLSPDHEYRILFMQRPLLEVLKSQQEMLRRGSKGGAPAVDAKALDRAFAWHLTNVDQWQASHPNMPILKMDYHSVLREPRVAAREIAIFLKISLGLDAMVAAVDPALYRIRLEGAYA